MVYTKRQGKYCLLGYVNYVLNHPLFSVVKHGVYFLLLVKLRKLNYLKESKDLMYVRNFI